MKNFVSLIGAGCAKFDLITLRGKHALENCEAVIFDDLTDKRLLEFCKKDCEKIYAGKRFNRDSITQDEINSLMLSRVMDKKNVVRLKGGDPFVFARGFEEITFLKENGIDYEVIPGICSAAAVPEAAEIPLTCRGISGGFHVISAMREGKLVRNDYEKYAHLNETLVILMGLSCISEISKGLISAGMDEKMPCAVVSQKPDGEVLSVKGELFSIEKMVKKEKIKSPAVIVIGKTAAKNFALKKIIRVGVCTSKRIFKELEKIFSAFAVDLIDFGAFDFEEIPVNFQLDKLLGELDEYECAAFTSPVGAEIFLKKLKEKRIDIRKFNGIEIAAIGNQTAKVFENKGIFPQLIADSTVKSLAEKLVKRYKNSGKKIFLARSLEGSPLLSYALKKENIDFTELKIYRPSYPESVKIACDKAVDFYFFASAGGVKNFFDLGFSIAPGAKVIALGQPTAERIKAYANVSPIIPSQTNVNSAARIILKEAHLTSSQDISHVFPANSMKTGSREVNNEKIS